LAEEVMQEKVEVAVTKMWGPASCCWYQQSVCQYL